MLHLKMRKMHSLFMGVEDSHSNLRPGDVSPLAKHPCSEAASALSHHKCTGLVSLMLHIASLITRAVQFVGVLLRPILSSSCTVVAQEAAQLNSGQISCYRKSLTLTLNPKT